MKKVLLSLLLFFIACTSFANANDTNEFGYVEGEIIVIIDDSKYSYSAKSAFGSSTYSEALNSMAESFAESTGLVSLGTFFEISMISGAHIIHLRSETKSTEELLQELRSNPYIKSVQPNYIRHPFNVPRTMSSGQVYSSSQNILIPNDTHYEKQWGMRNIGMPQVWEYATGSENICVAVIDSGIDYNHRDMNANMAKDSYGNYGRLFSFGAQSGNPMDSEGHGTHVAGIIGAVGNNGIGVTGVNWKVKLLAVNVMPQRKAVDTDVIAGIEYIHSEKKKGLNIRVANMSFGGWEKPLSDDSPIGRAVKSLSDAGIICAIAVGNDSENMNNPSGKNMGKLVYPACFRYTNTISVGSISSGDTKSSFSNYSSTWVDLAAPGNEVYSTTLNNNYGLLSGTSMSAPYVAGAAAILFAAFPDETASQIKERILKGARRNSHEYWRSGLLDVAEAYGIIVEPEIDEPMVSVEIAGEKSIAIGYSSILSHNKSPSNANGYFEYLWESGDESIAVISGKNTPSAEITGLSAGNLTITLTVTQTLPNATKTTKNSFDMTVKKKSSSEGCNSGLFLVTLLLVLPVIKTRK